MLALYQRVSLHTGVSISTASQMLAWPQTVSLVDPFVKSGGVLKTFTKHELHYGKRRMCVFSPSSVWTLYGHQTLYGLCMHSVLTLCGPSIDSGLYRDSVWTQCHSVLLPSLKSGCLSVSSLTNQMLQFEISRLVPPERRRNDLTCDDR